MSLTMKDYSKRLIDDKLDKYLNIFGAVSIEGPKWCGKTWTSLNHASSVTYMTEEDKRNLALVNPKYIFTNERPQLIDEWQLSPNIWDAVRHECDSDHEKGKFILTGSTTLTKDEKEEKIFHSGAGRIATLKMYPMSLYESGDSTGEISITDMLDNKVVGKSVKQYELNEIAQLIIRGGWPENLNVSLEYAGIIPSSYIENIINKDIHERKDRKRKVRKMRMLLKSLARNESSLVGNDTLVKDIEEYSNEEELLESRQTVRDYIGALNSLYLLDYQEAYSINYRSSKRIGKTPKKHLVDPSLSCALLDLSVDKLMHDFNTFGFMFEALVERDLRIYMDYLDAHLYYFRDNTSGDEVDAILEFKNGDYAAVEIKLTYNSIDEAKKNLQTFYNNVSVKPKFMCIIVSNLSAFYKDTETGIYILPITALKP